jgi:hypothetical protein
MDLVLLDCQIQSMYEVNADMIENELHHFLYHLITLGFESY